MKVSLTVEADPINALVYSDDAATGEDACSGLRQTALITLNERPTGD